MRALKSSPGLVLAACSALVLSASLAGCNSGLDSSFEGRSPRFATSAPLKNAKKDPDFLAYAVPETDLHLYPATRSGEYAVHGVDVSKYQGDIDWTAVKDSGVAFAFIKASEGGDSVDAKFQRNWALAKADGVPPVLDLEATPESRSCKRTLNREEVLPDLRKMLEALEAHYGKRPIIYTSVDFYQAILHSDALAEYPIWVRSTKYHPAVRYGSRNWTFWQYRSDGAVPGIPGNVDQNAFRGTQAE